MRLQGAEAKAKRLERVLKVRRLLKSLGEVNINNYRSRRPHSTIRLRNRGYALEEMQYLTDNEFKKMFRLSRESFHYLLSLIRVKIEPSDRGKRNARNAWGSDICATVH